MNLQEGDSAAVHHVRVDSSGRIALPASLREHLGIGFGDSVLVVDEAGACRIETATHALRTGQEHFASFVPEGTSLVDALLEERRAEAERE